MSYVSINTVEPRYNEVLGTMKITLLYQVSYYIGVKKQKYIELGPAKLPCYKRVLHTCQHVKVRKQNTRYCEGAKRPSPREGSSRGGEGVGRGCPPSQIVQSGAYLERKFRLKIYCIAWKATNLKIQKTERSVFWGFKNFKNRTVLLKTERLASLVLLYPTSL